MSFSDSVKRAVAGQFTTEANVETFDYWVTDEGWREETYPAGDIGVQWEPFENYSDESFSHMLYGEAEWRQAEANKRPKELADYINTWMRDEWDKKERGYSVWEFYEEFLQTAIEAYEGGAR